MHTDMPEPSADSPSQPALMAMPTAEQPAARTRAAGGPPAPPGRRGRGEGGGGGARRPRRPRPPPPRAFRTAHGAFLDTLLTRSVATLMAEGLVTLQRVALDGMRVRASAGAASFRRRPTLERCLAEAEAQVQALRAELEAESGGASQRERAARERAGRARA